MAITAKREQRSEDSEREMRKQKCYLSKTTTRRFFPNFTRKKKSSGAYITKTLGKTDTTAAAKKNDQITICEWWQKPSASSKTHPEIKNKLKQWKELKM